MRTLLGTYIGTRLISKRYVLASTSETRASSKGNFCMIGRFIVSESMNVGQKHLLSITNVQGLIVEMNVIR